MAYEYIIDEFKKAGLQTWNNSGSYLQSFAMVRTKFLGASCTFDGVSVDTKDVIVVTCTPDLQVTEKSGYEKVAISKGANLTIEARK